MRKNDSSKDKPVKASKREAAELSESALQGVSGGTVSEIHFTKHVDKSSPVIFTPATTSTDKGS
jgi:hypothetical protein